MGQRLGSMIGAIGGLVFVLVNAGAFGRPADLVVRIVGVVVFAVAIGYAVIRSRSQSAETRPTPGALRVYWICVLGEVIAIPLGAQVIVRVLDRPSLTLAWVVFVVGVHFLPFARAFRVPLFTWLGFALILVGVAGGLVALLVDPRGAAWAGVAAGFLLLAFAIAGGIPARR